jgi:hypothetical protein
MKTARAGAQEKRQGTLDDLRREVQNGSLVMPKMTEAQHRRYLVCARQPQKTRRR